MPVSVLIADDDRGFAALAADLLSGAGYRVAGSARDGAEAVAAVARLRPDALLLDVGLPDVDGITVARRLTAAGGAPRIVLTSSDPAAVDARALARAGAVAFVPKDELATTDLGPLLGVSRER